MLRLLRSLLHKEEADLDSIIEEKWQADLSNPRKARFVGESGDGYQAVLAAKGLELELRRPRVFAWVEDPVYRYADLVAEARLRFLPGAAYASAGLLFRFSDAGDYYAVLVSTKGYFRVDAVFNGTPMPLVGWTEAPKAISPYEGFNLRIIALNDRITVMVDEAWAAEIVDSTLAAGRVAFAAANYGDGDQAGARLESLRLDSRPVDVEAVHYRWSSFVRVDPAARCRLAETFLAMDQPLSALVQLKRAWKARSSLEGGRERTQAELLLAADCALRLSLHEEAEEYLDRCMEADDDSEDARRAVAEKARLLYQSNRFAELRDHAEAAAALYPEDAALRTLLGHAFWNLGAWAKASQAYDRALELVPENGMAALNAGRARDRLGDGAEAFVRYLSAARRFFASESWTDLATVLPRLKELDAGHPQVMALDGKRAYAAEDWVGAAKALSAAYALMDAPGAEADAAVPYLLGMLSLRAGKRSAARPLFERAVAWAPEYPTFLFRLAETRYILAGDAEDAGFKEALGKALEAAPADGWICNLAGQAALARGDLEAAAGYLEAARTALPDSREVAANRAELAFLRGDAEAALALATPGGKDPDAALANERGNILVRLERWEEAEKAYAEAAAADGAVNADYLRNRASCLVELGRYGEADEVLARAYGLDDSDVLTLDLIAYVAAKKGEYPRAEAAYRLGLEASPGHPVLLTGLAWTYLTMARWKSAEETIAALEAAVPESSAARESVRELRKRLLEATTRLVPCAGCDRSWRIPLDAPKVPALRLVAQPPDHLPAGSCPACGKTYCIGCAKARLDDGRFVCPDCGQRLKLADEGLKKLLQDWAEVRS